MKMICKGENYNIITVDSFERSRKVDKKIVSHKKQCLFLLQ